MKDKSTGKVVSAKLFACGYKLLEHSFASKTVETDEKTFVRVYTPGGFIELLNIQLAGKKRMSIEELLRGFRIANYEII